MEINVNPYTIKNKKKNIVQVLQTKLTHRVSFPSLSSQKSQNEVFLAPKFSR